MAFKPAKYGCGGKVVKSYQDGGKVEQKPKPKPKAEDVPLGDGLASNAASEIKNRRKQQMKDLGLKDGGKAMAPPKKGKKPKSEYDKAKEKGYGPGGPMTPGARGTYPPKKRK